MNHPGRPVLEEIESMAALGLDFVDLTLEPPLAAPWNLDEAAVGAVLKKRGLPIVGHTAYYLPLASPFESIRRAALEEAKRCLAIFARLGAGWMNVHPDGHAPFHSPERVLERNLESLRELLATARDEGVGLMIENLPGRLSMVDPLSELLDALPELGFHLDIGHANLSVPENTTCDIIAAFASRLRHVHLHDNKGGSHDLHLPLGVGNIDLAGQVRALKASGYNETITLEVFAADRYYLTHSRDVLRRLWDEAPEPPSSIS